MYEESYRKKLVEYFKKNLKKKYSQDALKISLINQGYSRSAVEKALEQANKELAREAPILKEKPLIKHEIVGDDDRPIIIKKSWWKRFLSE